MKNKRVAIIGDCNPREVITIESECARPMPVKLIAIEQYDPIGFFGTARNQRRSKLKKKKRKNKKL